MWNFFKTLNHSVGSRFWKVESGSWKTKDRIPITGGTAFLHIKRDIRENKEGNPY